MNGAPPNGSGRGGARQAAAAPSLWRFGPEDAPVAVRNAEAVLAHLSLFLGGWPLCFAGPGNAAGAAPDIDVVERADGGIDVVAAGGSRMAYANAHEAANGVAGALIGAFVARHPAMVCLHAGAALVGGGLVVVVGPSLAGKSSVALHLAAAGHRLYGDDRIAVDLAGAPRGLCLGLMPKVRLPLPPDCGARFAEFVEAYTELRDESAAYLKPWSHEAASFGEAAPLAALIVLEREDGVATRLAPLPRPALLRVLIESVTAPQYDADALVSALERLVRAVPGYVLRFGASREAARAIADFARRDGRTDG